MDGSGEITEFRAAQYVRMSTEHQQYSTHNQSDKIREYADKRGIEIIIAGAGGAAHLPGMVAGHTIVPVIGVPIKSRALNGMDSLLSIVQMPGGVPVATMAIGEAGATNAGLFAVAMLARHDAALAEALTSFRAERADQVRSIELER